MEKYIAIFSELERKKSNEKTIILGYEFDNYKNEAITNQLRLEKTLDNEKL